MLMRLFCFSFFTFLTYSIFAQSSIRGRILEGDNSHPIEFATVSVHHSEDSTLAGGVVTDSKGSFKVDHLDKGHYYVLVRFLGYETEAVHDIKVHKHEEIDLEDLHLEVHPDVLEGIEIQGHKETVLHKVDRRVYNLSEMQGVAVTGTAKDVLKFLPGCSLSGHGDISIRGKSDFMVLINGQPSHMDPSTILDQFSTSQIQQIEIITTPSSDYDPDGAGGIINIVTKKDFDDGLYFLTNIKAGSFNDPKRYGADFTTHYIHDKLDVYLGGNYKLNDIRGFREGILHTFVFEDTTVLPSEGEREINDEYLSMNGGLNYYLDKEDYFNFSFYLGRRKNERLALLNYIETHSDPLDTIRFFNRNLRIQNGDFFVLNADYNHEFHNHNMLHLSALYEYSNLWGPSSNVSLEENTLDQLLNLIITESNPLNGLRLKTDYKTKIGHHLKLSAGYQFKKLTQEGLHRTDSISNTGEKATDSTFSNKVSLHRDIHSLYGKVEGHQGKLEYSVGLRLMYTFRDLKHHSDNAEQQNRVVNPLPSLHLHYALGEFSHLKFGYSRRVHKPSTKLINPFLARRDANSFEQGDPELEPEFINIAELGFDHELKNGSLFAMIYYQLTERQIDQVSSLYLNNILLRTYANAGASDREGIELGWDHHINDHWKVFLSTDFYNYHIEGSEFNHFKDLKSLDYHLKAYTTFDIFDNLSFTLDANYISEQITTQGHLSNLFLSDASIKYNILKGNGSLTASLIDVFSTNKPSTEFHGTSHSIDHNNLGAFEGEVLTKNKGQLLWLTFSYHFNKHNTHDKIKYLKSEFGAKEF